MTRQNVHVAIKMLQRIDANHAFNTYVIRA